MKRPNIPGITILLILLLFVFNACQEDLAYTESHSIPGDGWAVNDTLVFSPSIDEAGIAHNLQLWVRHTKEYQYSNIWVKVISDEALIGKKDLVEITLADKSGRWLGTCSQSMCTQRIVLRENFIPEKNQAFKFSVVQYMREEVLAEVKNIGLEIVTSTDEN